MTGLASGVSRGLAPRCEPEVPEPHATVVLSPTETNPCHHSLLLPRSIIYLGMDVHKDSITIAVLPAGAKSADARRSARRTTSRSCKRYLERWRTDGEVRACYEASGAGYVLHRALARVGLCVRRDRAVADSEAARRAAEARQVRRERTRAAVSRGRADGGADPERGRGARARCRAVPRDVSARDPQVAALHPQVPRAPRVRLSRRHELVHAASALAAAPDDRAVAARRRRIGSCFGEYHALLQYKLQRRDELDREIERLARTADARADGARGCSASAGSRCTSAMVLATEIVDWRRFERPAPLAAYLGLVPREDSSGDRERKGSITKAGIATVVTCSCRRRGATVIGRRSASDLKRRQAGTAAGRDRARVEGAAAVARSATST